MLYHAVVLNNTAIAIVRPLTDGITDMEWEYGCQSIGYSSTREYSSKLKLTNDLIFSGLEVVDAEEWQQLIYSDGIGDDKYQKNKTYDKWEPRREIY